MLRIFKTKVLHILKVNFIVELKKSIHPFQIYRKPIFLLNFVYCFTYFIVFIL